MGLEHQRRRPGSLARPRLELNEAQLALFGARVRSPAESYPEFGSLFTRWLAMPPGPSLPIIDDGTCIDIVAFSGRRHRLLTGLATWFPCRDALLDCIADDATITLAASVWHALRSDLLFPLRRAALDDLVAINVQVIAATVPQGDAIREHCLSRAVPDIRIPRSAIAG